MWRREPRAPLDSPAAHLNFCREPKDVLVSIRRGEKQPENSGEIFQVKVKSEVVQASYTSLLTAPPRTLPPPLCSVSGCLVMM